MPGLKICSSDVSKPERFAEGISCHLTQKGLQLFGRPVNYIGDKVKITEDGHIAISTN